MKFRDAEELQTLDANRQSGGERSVSTMLYLISLQVGWRVRLGFVYVGVGMANGRGLSALCLTHLTVGEGGGCAGGEWV